MVFWRILNVDPIGGQIFNDCTVRWIDYAAIADALLTPSPVFLYLKSKGVR